MDWPAFFSYVLLNCITPGPNNMICLSSAAQHGFAQSLRYIAGVFAGSIMIGLLTGGFTSLLYDVLPAAEPWLLALGAAYILYLAWGVWRSQPREGGAPVKKRGVLSGVMMQFVNVKGILFSVTAMASYVLPNWSGPLAIALCSAIIACCCVVCCGVWALGGAALVGAYRKHARLISGVMALALVWCALSLLLELAQRLF